MEVPTGGVLWKKALHKNCAIIKGKHFCFPVNISLTFKDTYFEEYLRAAASEKEALIFYLWDWSFTTHWDMMGFSPFSFSWFFIRVLLFDYFTKKYIHLRKKYYKYCWCMQPFLKIIEVLLVYNPNYSSCFPPGWYYKILVFDLILKWDVETYQMEVMTK